MKRALIVLIPFVSAISYLLYSCGSQKPPETVNTTYLVLDTLLLPRQELTSRIGTDTDAKLVFQPHLKDTTGYRWGLVMWKSKSAEDYDSLGRYLLLHASGTGLEIDRKGLVMGAQKIGRRKVDRLLADTNGEGYYFAPYIDPQVGADGLTYVRYRVGTYSYDANKKVRYDQPFVDLATNPSPPATTRNRSFDSDH